MNHSGKNGYVREAWAGSTAPEQVKRYATPVANNALESFYRAAVHGDYDEMVRAANDLRRVSTRLLSFARMKQRQIRKQEAQQNASSFGV
jgi:hypothetical protein